MPFWLEGGPFVDYTALINSILNVERSARAISDEVVERQAHLNEELDEQCRQIRERYLAGAQLRLEQLEKDEQAKKERALAAQNARLAETSAKMERAYTRYGDNWVDTLFHQVVDAR